MLKINGYTFKNCCPHPVDIIDQQGKKYTIPEDKDLLIRVNTVLSPGCLAGFDDQVVSALSIENLPPEEDRTYFIVSNPVLQLLKRANVHRGDFRGLGKKLDQSNCRQGFISL